MLDKDKLLKTLDELPQSFSIDELIEHLIFVQKVEIGLKQSADESTVSIDEARKRMGKWLK